MKQKSLQTPVNDSHRPGGTEIKYCPGCRAVGYDSDIHCPHCGTLFGPVCPGCHTPISHPVAIYCVQCGEKLDNGEIRREG